MVAERDAEDEDQSMRCLDPAILYRLALLVRVLGPCLVMVSGLVDI